jgi:hypothetical protein
MDNNDCIQQFVRLLHQEDTFIPILFHCLKSQTEFHCDHQSLRDRYLSMFQDGPSGVANSIQRGGF